MAKTEDNILDYTLGFLSFLITVIGVVFGFLFNKYITKIESHDKSIQELEKNFNAVKFQKNQDEIQDIKKRLEKVELEQEENRKRDMKLMEKFEKYIEKHDEMFNQFAKDQQNLAAKINSFIDKNSIALKYVEEQIINPKK